MKVIIASLMAVALTGCATQTVSNQELCALVKAAPTLDDTLRYWKEMERRKINCNPTAQGSGIDEKEIERAFQMMRDYERLTGKPFPQ